MKMMKFGANEGLSGKTIHKVLASIEIIDFEVLKMEKNYLKLCGSQIWIIFS